VLTARQPEPGLVGLCRRHGLLLVKISAPATAGDPAPARGAQTARGWADVRIAGLWWHPLGVAAAAGMVVLLTGALITHRRALDSATEMAPALLTLAITIAYLAIAVTS
jgi:hypothetical protein